MPTRNVNLTKELDSFIARSVKRGRYSNASEVMRSALRLLEREAREDQAKLAALRKAIAEGDASGIAQPGVFDRIRREVQLVEESCVRMPAVQVSIRAEADIDSIAEYTTNTWGPIQADAYLAKLEDGFRLLARNPRIGRSCSSITTGTAPV